jgi:hypothetical protein
MAINVQSNPEVSTTSLVSGIVNDAQDLFKHQLELFKAELKQDMEKAREGAVVMALGAGLCSVGVLVLTFALAHLLHWAFPALELWGWYAVVGGIVTAAGVALIAAILIRIKLSKPLSITTTALEENVEWKTKTRK